MSIRVINFKFLFLIFSLIAYTSPAFAYLEPGTGSMLVQGLIGGVAMVMSFLSIYWQKVKAFFIKDEEDIEQTEED